MKAHTDRALRTLFVEHMKEQYAEQLPYAVEVTGEFRCSTKERDYQTYRQGYLLGYEQAGKGA